MEHTNPDNEFKSIKIYRAGVYFSNNYSSIQSSPSLSRSSPVDSASDPTMLRRLATAPRITAIRHESKCPMLSLGDEWLLDVAIAGVVVAVVGTAFNPSRHALIWSNNVALDILPGFAKGASVSEAVLVVASVSEAVVVASVSEAVVVVVRSCGNRLQPLATRVDLIQQRRIGHLARFRQRCFSIRSRARGGFGYW
jgi:hypothetical protein